MNSFVPVVEGRIAAAPGGSCLEGTMRLFWIVTLAMLLPVFFGGRAVVDQFRTNGWPTQNAVRDLLTPAAIPILFWTFTVLLFSIEARRTKRLLVQAAEGRSTRTAT
jgi:hypothetical protein